jgi:outer membrane receptor protein involved in Fe transport
MLNKRVEQAPLKVRSAPAVGIMRAAVVSAVTVMMTGGLSVVLAADEPAPSNELETIVVTAQKRAESEQNVPLSMTTFSSAALEAKDINNFFDYATKVPNLAFASTGDGMGTARTVAIRGVSGNNVTSFYIDDTPLPDSIDPRVLDIDHIEVLRGPQGTLYGARSMGGLVRTVTKTPDLENFTAVVHGGVSDTARTDTPNYVGDAVVNIPLVQGIAAVRISAFDDSEAGYFKRSYCTNPAAAMALSCTPLSTSGITTVHNVAAIDTSGFAIALTIKPSDSLTITPKFMLQREGYNGFPLADYDTDTANGIGYPVPTPATGAPTPNKMIPTSFTQARWFNLPEGGFDDWGLASLAIHWKNPWGELVSSTSYFSRKVVETEDESDFVYAAITSGAGGTPQPGGITEVKDYQEFVEEVRFVSDLQGPVQFVAGGFYSDLYGRLPFAAYYPPSEVPNLDNTLGGPNNPNYPNLIFAQDFHTDIKEPAVFGDITYSPIDPLKLTAGLRWYQVRESSEGYEEGLATGGGPAIISPPASTTETGTNPKIEADYHITPDKMVYANVAKGYRPGGLVPIVPPGQAGTATDCVAALKQVDPNISIQQTRTFQSDSLWNYELGTKTEWLDRRLSVDAAGFYIRWKNIQQEILLSCGFQYTANAGAATSKGGELEIRARPTDPLELSLGLGYQDAKISQASIESPQPVGSPIYQVPDWTGNGSAQYTTELGAGWKMVSGADYSYVGRSFSGNNLPSDPRLRPSYRLINARLAFDHGPFEVALYGKNLADEVANLGDSRSIAAETPGRPRLFVNQPRTLGLEFRQSF